MKNLFSVICAIVFFGFAIAIGTGYMIPDTWFVVFMCITIAIQDLVEAFRK